MQPKVLPSALRVVIYAHFCTSYKLNIIHCGWKCSHQVFHEVRIPSRYRSDHVLTLLQATQQCCRGAEYTFVLLSPAREKFCIYFAKTITFDYLWSITTDVVIENKFCAYYIR